MDCSLPGSCVHGILKARILEWLATPLQGIFPTQGSNLGFWHCRWVLYHLSHLGGSRVSSDFIHCRSQASLSHIQPTSSESEKCNPTSTLIKVPVLMLQFSSVQLLSHVQIFVTLMDCSRQGPPVHHQLLEFTQTQVHWVSDAIQPSHPLLSPSPPAFSVSQHQGLFKWVSSSHQVAKLSQLHLQHQSSWYSRLISFRMDLLDLLAVQGTVKSLLQYHSSKASVLRGSDFFIVHLSHPYMTTGKTTALTRQNFVGKVMSLLFNMLSRLVKTFLPRSKSLLISWLQSPSAVILEPKKKIKSHVY